MGKRYGSLALNSVEIFLLMDPFCIVDSSTISKYKIDVR